MSIESPTTARAARTATERILRAAGLHVSTTTETTDGELRTYIWTVTPDTTAALTPHIPTDTGITHTTGRGDAGEHVLIVWYKIPQPVWGIGDIVRTRTGRGDRIVTGIEQPCPPELFDARMARFEAGQCSKPFAFVLVTHRALRDGKPYGPVRTNRGPDLTLIRPAA